MKVEALYPFQQDVSNFIQGRAQAGIFVGYGGGKTYLSLKWLEDLGPDALPCLIIATTDLIYQWGKQIEKLSNFTYCLVEGSTKQRAAALVVDADLIVSHYDIFRSPKIRELAEMQHKSWQARGKQQHSFKCPGSTRFNSIIVDESTLLKEARTQRFKALYAFAQRLQYRTILTGKPILEDAEDIFAQMLFLDDGKTFGRAYWGFRDRYFSPGPPWNPYKWTLKPGANEAIAAKLSQSCIYIPEEIVQKELPPERHIKVYFKMPAATRKRYEELKKDFGMDLRSGRTYETNWAVTRSQKMHQLCQGVVYTDDGYELHHTLKLDWLHTNIPLMSKEGPLLVWSDLVRWLPLLKKTIPIDSRTYSGAQKPRSKEQAKNDFMEGKTDVLILGQQAGHKGLDLWRANQAVFVSIDYSADHFGNALKRCKRIGSEIHDKITYYHLIVEDSLDEIIYEAIQEKLDIGNAIMNHVRGE